MLLIHVPRLTNRLGYTLNVVFRHLLHTEFNITTDDELFEAHDGPKLCYGPRRIAGALHIKNCKLLFETSIEEKEVHAGKKDGSAGASAWKTRCRRRPWRSCICLSWFWPYCCW